MKLTSDVRHPKLSKQEMLILYKKTIGFLNETLRQRKTTVAVFLFLALFILTHMFILSKTFYIDEIGAIHTTFQAYGDIPLHLTQITKFAFTPFNLDEPIYF